MDSKKKRARPKERRKKIETRRTTTPRGQTIVVWQEPRAEREPEIAVPVCLEGHRVMRLVPGELKQGEKKR